VHRHPPGRVGGRPYHYHEGVTRRPGPTYDAGMTRRDETTAPPDRVVLTGGPLEVAEVVAVARGRVPVELGEEGRKRMTAARDVVERAVAEGRRVYGVSTGFGLLANTAVDPADLEELQRRIVLSHATATGDPMEVEVVRGMQLLRARTLTQGHSGVRPVVVEALLALLAAGVTPVIPEHGSVGASGDLAQLAHLALPLLGEGEVMVGGDRVPAAEGLRLAGLAPLRLSFKEGLSLVNGTEGMLALACLAVADAEALAAMADVACAMSIEGLLGTDRPFQARLHELRPHPGQVASAANLRTMLAGSPILASHRHSDHAIQDAYSLRCAPQVHGACRDVVAFARQVVERELGSVTDNPVVFASSDEVVSVGNFHGEPLAFVLDFLAIALAELADISERRVDRLLDPALNHDLPPFLARDPGLNSGLMLTQYTAAALVAECKVLAHPASVDSIPTSGNQEDHVSMGWTAGLKLRRVIANVRRALAIEALCAAQAIDLRAPLRPGAAVAAVLDRVRERVPALDSDRYLAPDLAALERLVADGTLVAAAEEVVGPLG
jgi:histidine ammonia-lyase